MCYHSAMIKSDFIINYYPYSTIKNENILSRNLKILRKNKKEIVQQIRKLVLRFTNVPYMVYKRSRYSNKNP
jgi:hypothetical protein